MTQYKPCELPAWHVKRLELITLLAESTVLQEVQWKQIQYNVFMLSLDYGKSSLEYSKGDLVFVKFPGERFLLKYSKPYQALLLHRWHDYGLQGPEGLYLRQIWSYAEELKDVKLTTNMSVLQQILNKIEEVKEASDAIE